MSCEVAVLPFEAHANCGTWSIDFGLMHPLDFLSSIKYIYLDISLQRSNSELTQYTYKMRVSIRQGRYWQIANHRLLVAWNGIKLVVVIKFLIYLRNFVKARSIL